MPKTVLTLNFAPRTGDEAESKNYDILDAVKSSAENKYPLLLSNQGALYIKKGVVDMTKVKGVRIEVITE